MKNYSQKFSNYYILKLTTIVLGANTT